jgi:hypothetical protein
MALRQVHSGDHSFCRFLQPPPAASSQLPAPSSQLPPGPGHQPRPAQRSASVSHSPSAAPAPSMVPHYRLLGVARHYVECATHPWRCPARGRSTRRVGPVRAASRPAAGGQGTASTRPQCPLRGSARVIARRGVTALLRCCVAAPRERKTSGLGCHTRAERPPFLNVRQPFVSALMRQFCDASGDP